MVSEVALTEIIKDVVGASFGDFTFAILIFLIVVGFFAWKYNLSLSVILVIGFPFLGALVWFFGNSSILLYFYAFASIVIGALFFMSILGLLQKSG